MKSATLTRTTLSLALAATMFLSYGSAQALETSTNVTRSTATAASATSSDQSEETDESIIIGGHTQSTDDTRYDYVPPSEATTRDATGYGVIGGFGISVQGVSIKIPSGALKHSIIGNGTWIRNESATYYATGHITAPWSIFNCNVRIDFQNRYSNGRIYKTWSGPTNTGCNINSWTFSRSNTMLLNVPSGTQQCARLYVGGKWRGEQCHYIR